LCSAVHDLTKKTQDVDAATVRFDEGEAWVGIRQTRLSTLFRIDAPNAQDTFNE